MDITVKGKQMDVGDALRTHTEDALAAAVTKYFDRAIDATVVYSKVQSGFHTDIVVHVGRGLNVHGQGEGGEAYSSAIVNSFLNLLPLSEQGRGRSGLGE